MTDAAVKGSSLVRKSDLTSKNWELLDQNLFLTEQDGKPKRAGGITTWTPDSDAVINPLWQTPPQSLIPVMGHQENLWNPFNNNMICQAYKHKTENSKTSSPRWEEERHR